MAERAQGLLGRQPEFCLGPLGQVCRLASGFFADVQGFPVGQIADMFGLLTGGVEDRPGLGFGFLNPLVVQLSCEGFQLLVHDPDELIQG